MRGVIVVLGLSITVISGRFVNKSAKIKCLTLGNFPNPTSTNPQKYIACKQKETGELVAELQICDDNEVFDPSSQKCEVHANFDRILLGTSVDGDDFTCEATALFEDDNSLNCEGYYQCVQQNGVLVAVPKVCPNGEIFMPELSSCVTSQFYNCPRGNPPDPDPEKTTTPPTVHTLPHTDKAPITGIKASWEEWWTYDGISGPGFWGLINPQWNMCNKGRRQSPINVEPEKLLFDPHLRPLHIDKHKVSGMLHNTGQSLVFRVDKDTKQHVNISGGPLAYRYQFEEIYIHYGTENSQGSEHHIHGYSFPAEIQLYGFNKELYHNMSEAQHKSQGIVGISLMVQIGDTPNAELRIITSSFGKVVFRGLSTPIRHISLRSLLPNTEHYMTYEGSTTHPGCWESTVWIIINKPIYITRQELYHLRRLMQGSEQTPKAPLGNNARPLQQLHHRTIRTNIDFKNNKNQNCPSMYKDKYYRANKWPVDTGISMRGRERSLSEIDTVFHSVH